MTDRLDGHRILILETREEAQFSRLLRDHGADVMQCPMFTINDAPDAKPIEDWMSRTIAEPFDDLVLTTGEGLRRLMGFARRAGMDAALIAAIAKTRIFARGPKPGRALREIGLAPEVVTAKPTTEGIIETLAALDLNGRRLGLQLYPEKDHSALIAAIAAQGARVEPVLPYVYDTKAAETNIVAAIDEMAAGRIDAIALTSSGQMRRLVETAKARGLETKLREAMARTAIASVGPVVSDKLSASGFRTDIYPANDAFFMRPLIAAMATALGKAAPKGKAGG